MHIETFETHEDMVDALKKRRVDALHGLHTAQSSLTYGDCWVQFHDVASLHIVFGRISTLEEVASAELAFGASYSEMVEATQKTMDGLTEGFMYGMAYDRFNKVGELGTTHKAHVWPIEDRLIDMARAVDFEIERLEPEGRLLLDIAFRAMRAHVIGRRS